MIIFGTKNIKRRVEGGLCIQKYCPKCRRTQELQEFRWTKYFTLFFIPVFPIEQGESVLTCTVCDYSYVIQPEDYIEGARKKTSTSKNHQAEPEQEKIIINCIHCGSKMRIPNLSKLIIVTCPHCKNEFEVKPKA
jgi:hypothetical protein